MTNKQDKNKNKVSRGAVKTPFGIILEGMNTKQKKVLDQLLFASTSPSENSNIAQSALGITNSRQLPQNEVKKDHLLLKEITLQKDMKSGEWKISLVTTNQGRFSTGKEQTEKIDQQKINKLIQHLKECFLDDLEAFIRQEKNNESDSD